ncbi:SDR family oxidoreductase [Pararobbsia silviterrae]|uniref:SDR family oxidoreductase n=1 Tax=Pararobbsia silviterrae TaxID=1792498 RepID=A0A494Y5R1_9BURK|nr:SDR family oxidoreductase [Pararobbsia silviterrae]RKP55656.1 SDR family oxidoreductase [Pararobbsia silviterrae]
MSSQAKVALVTGASRGIGKAVAQAFLDHGYRVVLAARALEPLEDIARQAREAGREALAVQTDVTDAASVDALFEHTRERFGRLDVLFNNAGIGAPAVSIDALSVEQWRAVVDTNLTGVFLCSRAAFALMKAQTPRGGRIINNGSISAHAPRPFSAPYTSTKHAVAGLTKALSLDGRAFDIACGQIDIGNAATDMTERMAQGVLQANGELASEPRIDVAHVANAVLYMAGLPLEANVQFMTVMATKMPFIGRG